MSNRKPQKKRSFKLPQKLQSVINEEELSVYEEYYNLASTKKIREAIVKSLNKQIEESFTISDKTTKYESPAWSEYQADAIGFRRALKELINHLK